MLSHIVLFPFQIHDGPNAASKQIGTYCHSDQIINLESSSNSIFIRMVTDVSNQERGFEMKFSASKKKQLLNLYMDKINLLKIIVHFRLQACNS